MAKPYPAILDTDIANEIDDPFAIAHAILSPEAIDLKAITIAPFAHSHVPVEDSQELSLELGRKTLALMPRQPDLVPGATSFMANGAVPSPAVDRIIEESRRSQRLHVLAIGAATNVASALLLDPTLADRIVVVWLGGHAPEYPRNDEYNLRGDLAASQSLFASRVPLVHYPAIGVTSHLFASAAALRQDLAGSPRGDFFVSLLEGYRDDHFAYEKELWDVGVTSYLVDPAWSNLVDEPKPLIADDCSYIPAAGEGPYKRATFVNRNAILGDLFRKIARSVE
jgi:purine nucleosidase